MKEHTRQSQRDQPSPQRAPAGPHPRLAGRDARGCFSRHNTDAITHGARSQQRREELAPLRREIRAAILADRGFTEADVPRVVSIIVDQFCEARLIAASYFQFLADSGGPITTKGRQRRAVDGYLRASDRVTKLAQVIGLGREPRDADLSLESWLAQTDDAADEKAGDDPAAEHGGGTHGDPV